MNYEYETYLDQYCQMNEQDILRLYNEIRGTL